MKKVYVAIDLKSFYSSVECRERGLDPLTTNLVVADASRTDKTICLAISPSLKSYGLPGRARLFEVLAKVREINYHRLQKAPAKRFAGKSSDFSELCARPELALDFIIAKPRMQKYLDYSRQIYQVYLKYLAPEDIFAYSIDEVFCDISSYLKFQKFTPCQFVTKIIQDVHQATGITATAGIGTNLYLAKIAMDIIAKHAPANDLGVRIGELNEQSYREQLWSHQPITDFWRIGPGTARRLRNHQMRSMGDVARCSLINEELLFKLFGVNAELLIDHAWGIEPATIADVKKYRPEHHSLCSGQVLPRPYQYQESCTIIKEMSENLALKLAKKQLFTDQLVLHVIYDKSNVNIATSNLELKFDRHRRLVPKPSHGTLRLALHTNSLRALRQGFLELFQQVANPHLTIRKLYLTAGNLHSNFEPTNSSPIQTSLFDNPKQIAEQKRKILSEQNLQRAILKIRERYGKNSILTGANFEPGATGRLRHRQIGGHSL